jgi:hypothetical protein
MRAPESYVGKYEGCNGLLNLHILMNDTDDLCTILNGRRSSKSSLIPFSRDIYSYFIPDFDTCMSRGIAMSKFEQTLLEFNFEEAGSVSIGLWWPRNSGEERGYFRKISS